MPVNWYLKQKQTLSKSRYVANITADVFVPFLENKEEEQEKAKNVLGEFLPEDGFAGPMKDSNVRLRIMNVAPYG